MRISDWSSDVCSSDLVVTTLEMAHAILLEASLSFLGLGVQPPLPSWGLMIAEGRNYLFFDQWVVTVPGVALFLLVLSINLVGDGIRDRSEEPTSELQSLMRNSYAAFCLQKNNTDI